MLLARIVFIRAIAKPGEPAGGQDERRIRAAVDSPRTLLQTGNQNHRPCRWFSLYNNSGQDFDFFKILSVFLIIEIVIAYYKSVLLRAYETRVQAQGDPISQDRTGHIDSRAAGCRTILEVKKEGKQAAGSHESKGAETAGRSATRQASRGGTENSGATRVTRFPSGNR